MYFLYLFLQFDPLEGAGIDWTSDVDRLKVMKMVIKMADINTPTKSHDLHRSWTVRITEEFYQQVRKMWFPFFFCSKDNNELLLINFLACDLYYLHVHVS